MVLNGGRCRHQYSEMLNQVYSTHLQAQIQQHATANHPQNLTGWRYRQAHQHSHNNHLQPLHHAHHHHHPLQHHQEHPSYHQQGILVNYPQHFYLIYAFVDNLIL